MTITNAPVLPGLVKELKHSLKMLTVKSLNILAYSGLSYKAVEFNDEDRRKQCF